MHQLLLVGGVPNDVFVENLCRAQRFHDVRTACCKALSHTDIIVTTYTIKSNYYEVETSVRIAAAPYATRSTIITNKITNF